MKSPDSPSSPAVPDSTASIAKLAWALRILGFFSGGAVMIVEFSGNRLLSPVFGNSLYTWTGLIGVILVALSCGDFLGGWLIDRFETSMLLPALFSLGGVLTAAIPTLARLLPAPETQDVVSGPVYNSLFLFFLPGLVLAAITPVSIRLLSKASGDHKIGTAAGTVGMSAALGSFAGTFATSYLLIPNFGVRKIFVILGCILLAVGIGMALLVRGRTKKLAPFVVLWMGGIAACIVSSLPVTPDRGVIFTKDTFYHRISVIETPTARGVARLLKLDSTMEGAQEMTTGEVLFDYQKYWTLTDVFCPSLTRAAFLGAGAFGMPEQLSERFKESTVDVVEIDPAVVEVGHHYFNLDKYPRVHAHAEDARRFLRRSTDSYDFIFGDAYNGVQYVPAHLVTKEFFATVHQRLRPNGVYMMNLISAIDGPSSELFWRVYHSLQESFPHIMIFGTVSYNPMTQQNVMIVASGEPLEPRIEQWKTKRVSANALQWQLLQTRFSLPAQPTFTGLFSDDSNPVEYVVARQVKTARR